MITNLHDFEKATLVQTMSTSTHREQHFCVDQIIKLFVFDQISESD